LRQDPLGAGCDHGAAVVRVGLAGHASERAHGGTAPARGVSGSAAASNTHLLLRDAGGVLHSNQRANAPRKQGREKRGSFRREKTVLFARSRIEVIKALRCAVLIDAN
jgi:hypothetical protein